MLKKSNIDKKLTPHTLRHTHTSLLAEAGVDLQRIMDRQKIRQSHRFIYILQKTEKKKPLTSSVNS
ncbi:tyrosine-type recombinase/integrase [Bacillus atrophaeus]|uniref:tyrosine-type recombinase/integrase n=1 Tax=Bacillus atrophaeus TaxID=1452 RepID=UPI003BAD7553